MMHKPPRVFISYSHDSEAHRDLVLGLADRLRAEGVESWIDQYVPSFPVQGWLRWMIKSLVSRSLDIHSTH